MAKRSRSSEGQQELNIDPTRWPIPHRPAVSGLYTWSRRQGPIHAPPTPTSGPIPLIPPPPSGPLPGAGDPRPSHPYDTFEPQRLPLPSRLLPSRQQEFRLDVDGHYPQMTASGTVIHGLSRRLDWVAEVTPTGSYRWSGTIWYKNGQESLLPHTHVDVEVTGAWMASQRKAKVTFHGNGRPATLEFKFKSPSFHPVEFEFDWEEGTEAVTEFDPCEHPNHPDTMPCEPLTIEEVFRRSGFKVTTTPGTEIPSDEAGSDDAWSDQDLHDAMQQYWTRFADKPQWAMWVFFASTAHTRGNGLGGIMFDDIDPNHRQGVAIFNNSFIANPPAGDPAPEAWVERMRFWTACHEIGHGFNLAHSWQKELGVSWIPISNDDEARSFMNYPFRVSGGQSAFFADFENRFIDDELLFMRHAPERFVQMGNADWFDHHAFEQAEVSPEPTFALTLRVNRERPIFEYLEPPMLELKLTNISGQPQLVGKNVLEDAHHLTVIIKREGGAARQWAPFAHYCMEPEVTVLEPGRSLYTSLFAAVGLNGWDLAEPGVYHAQVALKLGDWDVVSNPLRLRIAPPRSYDEQYLAQDFFSEPVGRILAFDGTRVLESANDALREIVERLADRKVAHHARVALGCPLTRRSRVLEAQEGAEGRPALRFRSLAPDTAGAKQQLQSALLDDPDEAAETLGHIDYNYYTSLLSDFLAEAGDRQGTVRSLEIRHQTLTERGVPEAFLQNGGQPQPPGRSTRKKTTKRRRKKK